MKKLIVAVVSAVLFSSCVAGLIQIEYPDSFQTNGRKVSATIVHKNWFGFKPLRGTEKVIEKLAEKCDGEGSKVTGITVEVFRKYAFFLEKTEITATGICCCEEDGGSGSSSSDDDEDNSKSKSKKKTRRRRR